ncbi:Permease YjgP/YjgQ family protein [Elusimicrobium minutum Pei191]|uniref:Permease YjgP/YjgQ family protein n=1 Tax=Elusimicrobium minutum (strain Pei191) TaxID=445932 RepID=B2KAY1_ELUMP|nr:LptF/LptG family permease [Elusimicrobium minutum]ACC97677.1 Permease YjgP/YjgQ family protein [Elusimicrobium minutum Pei191]
MRINIISKYMIKNLLTFFLGALFVLVFIFFMMHFIKLFNLAMTFGADMLWVFKTLVKLVPDVFSLCAPMAFQLAVLLTLGNMSENGEIIALRAAGFSFKEITKPLFIFALFLFLVIFSFTNWITPKNTKSFLDARNNVRGRIGKVILEPKTFMEIGDWSLYMESLDPKTNLMSQVRLLNKNDSANYTTKINALSGIVNVTSDYVGLKLFDGQMQRVSSEDPSKIMAANFKSYHVTFPLVRAKERRLREEEFTTPQLIARIYSGELTDKERAEHKTNVAMRQVLALSPLVLVLLSCPLVFSFGKRANKAWGMLWSIVIVLSFYMLLMAGVSLGKKYEIAAYFAPFLPIAAGLIVSRYLWKTRLKR